MRAPMRIRLSRPSKRPGAIAYNGRPFYNVVLTQSTTARDKRPIEILGTYDPLPQPMLAPPDDFGIRKLLETKEKRVTWNRERIVMWLRQGATPSATVVKLLVKGGILDPSTKYQGLWKLKPWRDSRPIQDITSLRSRPVYPFKDVDRDTATSTESPGILPPTEYIEPSKSKLPSRRLALERRRELLTRKDDGRSSKPTLESHLPRSLKVNPKELLSENSTTKIPKEKLYALPKEQREKLLEFNLSKIEHSVSSTQELNARAEYMRQVGKFERRTWGGSDMQRFDLQDSELRREGDALLRQAEIDSKKPPKPASNITENYLTLRLQRREEQKKAAKVVSELIPKTGSVEELDLEELKKKEQIALKDSGIALELLEERTNKISATEHSKNEEKTSK